MRHLLMAIFSLITVGLSGCGDIRDPTIARFAAVGVTEGETPVSVVTAPIISTGLCDTVAEGVTVDLTRPCASGGCCSRTAAVNSIARRCPSCKVVAEISSEIGSPYLCVSIAINPKNSNYGIGGANSLSSAQESAIKRCGSGCKLESSLCL